MPMRQNIEQAWQNFKKAPSVEWTIGKTEKIVQKISKNPVTQWTKQAIGYLKEPFTAQYAEELSGAKGIAEAGAKEEISWGKMSFSQKVNAIFTREIGPSSPFLKTGTGEMKSAIGADGLSLGQYIKNVISERTIRRVATGAGIGAGIGGIDYALDPNKLDENGYARHGHSLADYLAFGAQAGALLSLLAIARPALNYWSRQDKAIGLVKLGSRPDLAVKMSIAAALDFGAMMPAWKLVQAPVDIGVHEMAQTLHWEVTTNKQGIFAQSREKAFAEMDASPEAFDKTFTEGLSNGYKLGPLLGLFTKPLESQTGVVATLSGAYHSTGMVGTIAMLSGSQALADFGIRQFSANRLLEIRIEAINSVNKAIKSDPSYVNEEHPLSMRIKENEDKLIAQDAQSMAFVSLFLMPSPKPMSGDMMRGLALKASAEGRTGDMVTFATLAQNSVMEDTESPQARESIRQSLKDIQDLNGSMDTAHKDLLKIFTEPLINALLEEGTTQFKAKTADLKRIAGDDNQPLNTADVSIIKKYDLYRNAGDTQSAEEIADHLINTLGLRPFLTQANTRGDIINAIKQIIDPSLKPADKDSKIDQLTGLINTSLGRKAIDLNFVKKEDVLKPVEQLQAKQAHIRAIESLRREIKGLESSINALKELKKNREDRKAMDKVKQAISAMVDRASPEYIDVEFGEKYKLADLVQALEGRKTGIQAGDGIDKINTLLTKRDLFKFFSDVKLTDAEKLTLEKKTDFRGKKLKF